MIKVQNSSQLFDYVSVKDILHILDFSGRNDKTGSEHEKLRKKYSHLFWKSLYKCREYTQETYEDYTTPGWFELDSDEFNRTLVKCIQDFYWWAHNSFDHCYGHIYKRVVRALQIEDKLYISTFKFCKGCGQLKEIFSDTELCNQCYSDAQRENPVVDV